MIQSGLLCIPIGWFSVTTARKTLEGLYALYGGTARKALHQLVLSSEDNPYSPNFASTPRRPLAYPTRQTSWSAIFTLALWYSSLCCFAGTFLAGLFIFNKFRPWMHSKTASTSPPSTSLRAQVTQETLHNESRRHRHDLLDWRVFAKTELLKLFFQIGLGLLLTGTCEFVRSLWPVPGKLSTILFTVFQATFIWHLVLTWSSLLETLSSTFSSQPIPPQPQNSYHPPDRPNGSPQQSEVLIFDDGYIESSLQREFADSEGGAVINCIKRILSYRLHQPIQSLHDSFLAKLQHISIQARLTLIQVIVDALNREADSWYQPGPSSSTFSVQQAQHGNSLDNKRDGTHDSSDEDEEKWKPWMNEAIAGLDTMVESLQQHSSQSPSTQSTEANVGRLLVRLLDHGEVVARGLIVALSTSPRFSLRLWLPLISKSEGVSNILAFNDIHIYHPFSCHQLHCECSTTCVNRPCATHGYFPNCRANCISHPRRHLTQVSKGTR